MTKKDILYLSVLLIVSVSCNSNSKSVPTSDEKITQKVSPKEKDTAAEILTVKSGDSLTPNNNPFTKENDTNKEDPELQNTAHQSPAVKRHLKELKKTWKNTANPLIATYEGNNFGDYQHIIFKDAKGNTYDFGQAANNYGKYKLHELSGQYDDNPAWLGKKFKVYWEWKLSHFLCCEGDYDKSKGYLPSITKLELIKN